MRQSEIVVEGENLTIGYQVGKKRTEVHAGLNFQLFRGELTCLLGLPFILHSFGILDFMWF